MLYLTGRLASHVLYLDCIQLGNPGGEAKRLPDSQLLLSFSVLSSFESVNRTPSSRLRITFLVAVHDDDGWFGDRLVAG